MVTQRPFLPRPGRIRQTPASKLRRYSGRVLRAVGKKRSLRGIRSGHVPKSLPARHGFAGLRQRRVVVQVHIVKGAQMGSRSAAHVKYLQRESAVRSSEATRDGQAIRIQKRDRETGHLLHPETGTGAGHLYDGSRSGLDGEAFLRRSAQDRHQFRIMVSPEDGHELASLTEYTRDLMSGIERDLGTRLDWIAVNHFNTGHPHTHIVLRGKDDRGRDLVLDRDYISYGLRKRASRHLTQELGPRRDRDIAGALKREVSQARFTSLDRDILKQARNGHLRLPVPRTAFDRFQRSLLQARLGQLEKFDLAKRSVDGRWQFDKALASTLKRMGERGDIIRSMQRLKGDARERLIFDNQSPDQAPVRGTLIGSGIEDELRDRKFILVATEPGQHWYVSLGEHAGELPRRGTEIEVAPCRGEPKPSDRVIDRIAKRHNGIYSAEFHQAHDGPHGKAYLTAHKRRLEALRRKGLVARLPDGSWQVPGNYLSRVQAVMSQGPGLTILRQREAGWRR